MTTYRIVTRPEGFSDWQGLRAFIGAGFGYMDARIDPPSSFHRMSVADFAQKAQDETLILAVDDGGAMIGCCFAALRADAVYVGKLAVAPHARGRGVARALFNAAEDLARAHDKDWLELQTRVELTENHQTFARLGFVKSGESAHAGYDRPTNITMRRPVTSGACVPQGEA